MQASMAGENVPSVSRAGSQNFPKLAAIMELATQGDARAQFKLGDYHYAQGEYKEAVRWYDQSARQGHAVAQTALANCYASGRGVKRDPSRAAQWSRLAAHQKALPQETMPKKPVSASNPQGIQDTTPAGQSPVTPTASVTPNDGADASGAAAEATTPASRAEGAPQQSSGAAPVSQIQATRDVPSPVVSRVWKLEAPRPVIQNGDQVVSFWD
jgi:TPR repeat protein